eukprot:12207990-Ditylum_brightwellii.AAC.1
MSQAQKGNGMCPPDVRTTRHSASCWDHGTCFYTWFGSWSVAVVVAMGILGGGCKIILSILPRNYPTCVDMWGGPASGGVMDSGRVEGASAG